jgi:FMN-dependent oxidoreductase (nitrilotriacetate monooxygenase family)
VTSWDAFTGENFRRGGFLAQEDRYDRAEQFLRTAWELFDSWRGDEIAADKESGRFLADPAAGAFRHKDRHFDIAGRFNVPRSPQGRPVIFQAGDSDEGRTFAAATADAIFSRHATLEAGQAFYRDVKGRLARFGRTPEELLILPAATFVLGDTDEEAQERAHEVRRAQVSGQTAIKLLEQVWNRDLSAYDPDGPLPEIDPDTGEQHVSQGRASVRMVRDPLATAREWRALAEAEKLSIRDLIIRTSARQTFIGSARTVARSIEEFVAAEASDGFILAPHITPGGLDEFADTVVPLLQERGVFRHDYEGTTLRDHLGLRTPEPAGAPARSGAEEAAS